MAMTERQMEDMLRKHDQEIRYLQQQLKTFRYEADEKIKRNDKRLDDVVSRAPKVT